MTNLSLKYRIALVIFVLETLMITAVLWTTSTESFLAAKNFQKDQENVFFEVLNELSVTALLTEEFGDVQYFFEQMVQKPDINTAILVDAAGKIVASSKIALIGDNSSPSNNTAIRFWRKMDIESPAGVLGILSIEFSNEALVGTNAKIRNRGITIAVVGMSIILIIGIAVGFALTRRLNKLSIAARAFANGDMRVQSDISGGDEVAELGKTFNEMVKTVAESQALVTKEKEQFQLLLDSTAEAIIGLDNDKQCIFVNRACVNMLGYQDETSLLNEPILKLIKLVKPIAYTPGTDVLAGKRNDVADEINKSDVRNPSSFSVAFRKDATTFPIEYWQHPMLEGSVVTGSVVTFVDITQTKQKEYELDKYRNHLEELVDQRSKALKKQAQIIDQINDAVVSSNLNGEITSWNNGATALFGYDESEILGRNIDDLYFSDSYLESIEKVLPLLIENGKYETELRMLKKSGEQFIAHLSLSVLSDDDNNMIGIIGYSLDITDRKNVEEALKTRTSQLEISNKELSAFSYSVSHDLRSPLRGINGFCHVLLEDYADKLDDDGKMYLERITNNSTLMGKLIDDMLALSRISQQKMVKQQVNLSEIAEGVVAELTRENIDRNVNFKIRKDMVVYGDEDFLTIALTNLLGNAWKYTRNMLEADIVFDYEIVDGVPRYRVKDNGAGFDMKYADKLFGAFQRLHHKDEFEGTGVGLATVARIVHRHGGLIWADAKLNKGATFYFTLE